MTSGARPARPLLSRLPMAPRTLLAIAFVAFCIGVGVRLTDFAFRSSALEPVIGVATAVGIWSGLMSPILAAFLRVQHIRSRGLRAILLAVLAALGTAVGAAAVLVFLLVAAQAVGA